LYFVIEGARLSDAEAEKLLSGLVDDPTLSMVAIRRGLVSFSGASVSMTVQRPLNSSISAMSLRISGVIVMFFISCMTDIHFHPFIANS
jgi:hypothetical protein